MAAKLPVVAVDASGVCDIVKDGANGFKTAEDVEEWFNQICVCLENEHKKEKLQCGALETAYRETPDYNR